MAEKSSESATSCSADGATDTDIQKWPEVLQRLKRNDPTLTFLGVQFHDKYSDRREYFHPRKPEDWRRLGEAIAANTALRRLHLRSSVRNCVHSASHEVFYAHLKRNTTIRRLKLHHLDLAPSLFQFLERSPILTSLSVTGHASGSREGTRLLSSPSAWNPSSLKYLDLSGTGTDDAACEELIEALRSRHPNLKSLELNGNHIQHGGCVAISSLLNDPNFMLVRIFLDNNSINDEGAAALANGLVANTSLKTLSIHGNPAISLAGHEAFSKALCNARDIDSTLLSNHTLERLYADGTKLSGELKSSLRLNRARNKRYVANRKFVLHHLVHNCNWDLFANVPGGLVPSVLAMIAGHAARSKAGKNDGTDAEANLAVDHDYKIRQLALHRIVRRCPSVCERNVVRPQDGEISTSSRMSGDTLGCVPSKRMRLS